MPKPTKVKLRHIVVVSDTHCGCRLALCPRDGVGLDDGGTYKPSRNQLVLNDWWEEFWGDWVPRETRGEPFNLVHNGDVIDGVHHNSTTQISHNLNDQKAMAITMLKPCVDMAEGRYYHVRGTEAHVGQSAASEEEVAKALKAISNRDGQHARWEMWMALNGHLIHFLHHIGTTSSSAHETSAINAELSAEFVEAARWGEKIPSVVVRSHRHRSAEVRIPTSHGYATAVVTPAWQLKTPFTYKIAGARLSPPQIGGILIKLDDTGGIYTKTFVRHVGRSEVVC